MINPAWNKGYVSGFTAGASSQRTEDISSFAKIMNELETIKGVGPVLKERIITALYQKME